MLKIYSIEFHRNGSDADSFYCLEASNGKDHLLITFDSREINESEEIIKESIRVVSLNRISFRWQGASFADDITQKLNYFLSKFNGKIFYDLVGCKLDKELRGKE